MTTSGQDHQGASVRRRRIAAIAALVLGAAGFGLAIVVAVQAFPRGLITLACVAIAVAAAWYGALRRGAVRVAGLSVGVLGAGAAIVLLVGHRLLEAVLVVGALALSTACARAAFGFRRDLPAAQAPRRPVLFYNPKSGGGKAERFSVAAEARARGIEPIELGPPWDPEGPVPGAGGRCAYRGSSAGGNRPGAYTDACSQGGELA